MFHLNESRALTVSMAQLLSVHNLSQTSLQSTQDQGIPNIVLTEDDEKFQRNGSIGSISINSDISLPKIDGGPPDDYNNNAHVLKKLQQAPVDLSWENLSFSVSKGWRKKETKTILKDLSGLVTSGELTAIMGPSGAGKSTLMNILSGFLNAKHEGKILVNNKRRNLNMFRKLCCYITQDDYLLPHLTVLEAVTVAANLKIPSSVSKEERKQMVSDVIEMLGLTECEKTKTIYLSGGQKKRLSIAQELVSNPPVMFFDEPTSGLDSALSYHCITLLQSLARGGRTIICSIHQPSSRIFQLFDRLYVLSAGQCVYNGTIQDLIPFLSSHGMECPSFYNPADYIMEIASGEIGDKEKLVMVIKCEIEDAKKLDESLEKSNFLSVYGMRNSETRASTLSLVSNKEALNEDEYHGYPRNSFTQFRILLVRTFLSMLREPTMTKVRFFSHVGVGLLTGVMYLNTANIADKIFNNVAFLFLSILFLCFTAMLPTILTFPAERSGFFREHLNGWYSTKTYYLAKTLADMPFQIVFPIMYGSIVYWMTGQPSDTWRFCLFLCFCVFTSLVGQSLVIAIGATTSAVTAVFIAPVACIPFALFCGFFISLKSMPMYLRWFSYTSFFRYSYEGFMLTLYGFDRPKMECDALCYFRDPYKFLKLMGIEDAELYVCFIGLVVLFVVLRIIGYCLLCWKLRMRSGGGRF